MINTDDCSVRSDKGVATMFRLGATERMYGDYELTVTNKGGHSSEPRADNAICELSQALIDVSKYRFPFELNNVSRPYLSASQLMRPGSVRLTSAASCRPGRMWGPCSGFRSRLPTMR